jgi:NAD+ synthase (glutamine-hydrolysing)
MRLIKLGAAVLNQTPLDWAHNRANILGAVAEARAAGVGVLCLPELCVTGYGCEDAFHSTGLVETAWRLLEEIAAATAGMVVSVGLPVLHRKGLYNASCLLVDGRVAGVVAKRFLAGDGIHYEPRWFKPWPAGESSELRVGDRRYPIGDLHFDVGGVRIGYEICEDAWVADRPGAELARRGVDVILNPSGSHFAFGKLEVRERLVLEGSRAFGVAYVYTNLLGNDAGRVIYDGGALIAAGGRLCAVGPRLSFADRHVTSAVADIDLARMQQARTASYRPEVTDPVPGCVEVPFSWPALDPAPAAAEGAAWEASPHLKEEEFTRAEALGLFDYLRKSRSSGFVVSLSGGADSAAVSCLVALMVELAVAELGREGFLAKLRHVRGLDAPAAPAEGGIQAAGDPTVRELVGRLLTCVYQGTEHSSETTRRAARQLADGIGAAYHELEIDRLVKDYVALGAGAMGRPLDWERDDLALQNIQARVRGPGVWLLANLKNALLLATSNRSEASVGYATMDGDTCGGLSPIAGIDKFFLRKYLVWLEREGPAGLHPVPSLAAITCQRSTPELRPATAAQVSEGDLMPFELLDDIERAFVRDRQSPLDIFRRLRPRYPQHDDAQLVSWIERYFRLFCRNQWKRERYAPSFHLDDENLDPKTWCRFPILSGGYERELEELRRYVAEGGRPTG